MSQVENLIEQCYEQAKLGEWERLLSEWHEFKIIAKRCSRYQKELSGWTFLHQAAYVGHVIACKELIRLGASPIIQSKDGETPANVAVRKGRLNLAALLKSSEFENDSLWVTSTDPDLLPSSCLWTEANSNLSTEAMLVAYAGGVVKIPARTIYYTDSFSRVLMGWHGTYNPPCGMDGESMLLNEPRCSDCKIG